MTDTEFHDARKLWQMLYANHHFGFARESAQYIHDKNLEFGHPLFYQLMTATYTLYGKPFREKRSLPLDMVLPEFLDMHNRLLTGRDKLYAHTDANAFYLPTVGEPNQVEILRTPNELIFSASFLNLRSHEMQKIVKLCQSLEDRTEEQCDKLRTRLAAQIPPELDRYVLNILHKQEPVWLTREQSDILCADKYGREQS